MARVTSEYLRAQNPVFGEILDGDFDGIGLENLEHAIAIRKKQMFRVGAKVRLVNTGNVELEGKVGEILKVNQKKIAVGLGQKGQWGEWSEGECGIPPRMLEVV